MEILGEMCEKFDVISIEEGMCIRSEKIMCPN